jgi:regulator of sigma E protease
MQAFIHFGGLATIAYLGALIVIVFVHEMGHFLVGRWCGVKVNAFSLGFGPELWGFVDAKGTRWKLCAIPLGGYVKFEGDANAASQPDSTVVHAPNSLAGAALYKRALIVVAGPMANFILSIAIFATVYAVFGIPTAEPRVGQVVQGGAAEVAGLKAGDLITSIDGRPVAAFSDLQEAMTLRGEEPLLLHIDRAGAPMDFQITPKIVEVDDGLGGKVKVSQIGIQSDNKFTTQHVSPVAAVGKGVERTWFIGNMTMRFIGKLIVGQEDLKQLHGPVGVAVAAGDTAQLGLWPFIYFIGIISVSIGLVNLFPIPMLDGGHLLFYFLEAVLGRPISPQTQEWGFRIGLSALLVLMVVVSTSDVFSLLGH